MTDPTQSTQNQAEPDEATIFVEAMVERLAKVIPTKTLAEANRRPLAESFVDMLGRLVEFLEQIKPMDHGQMAALLYFIENLKLDRVGSDAAFVMTTLVDGARLAARNMRRKRAS